MHPLLFRARADHAPFEQWAEGRQRDVLPDRSLLKQSEHSIGGHQDDAGGDRISSVAQRQLLAARKNRAAFVTADAGDAFEEFILSLALERGHAEDFAGIELKGNVVEKRPAPQAPHLERWLGARWRPPVPLGRRRARRRRGCRRLAQHQLDDALLMSACALRDADGHAVAQDRRPVAQGGDLGHPVGDEDDGVAPLAPAPHHRIDALREVRGKGRRDLVEEQDCRLRGERAGEVDQPQQRVGKVADELPKIEARDAELAEPFADRLVRGAGQPHVLADGQVRHQGRVLIDGDDAGLARLRRRTERLRACP